MDIYGVDLLKDEGYAVEEDVPDGPFQDLLVDIKNTYDRKADTSEHKLRPGTEYVVFKKSVAGRRRKTKKSKRRARKTCRSRK